MRAFAFLLTLLLALPAAGQHPFALETEFELLSDGDFSGDGSRDVAIVDRETGAAHFLIQQPDGSFAVGDARPTGVSHPTAIGVGHVLSTVRDSLAVTAPDWNLVHLLDLTRAQPIAAPQAGLGPTALAVLDLPGPGNDPAYDDLMVATGADSPPDANHLVLGRVTAGGILPASVPVDAPLSRGRRVLFKSGGDSYGAFLASSSELADEFRAYGPSGVTLAPVLSFPGVLPGSDYATGFFNGSPLAHVLIYTPGLASLAAYPVVEPSPGAFEFDTGTSFQFADPILLVSTVNFGADTWLLILFDGGAGAKLYDFDGLNAPVERASFQPPPGERFTGALPLGGGDFLLSSGFGGRSSAWQRHDFDGGVHTPAGAGSWIPARALASAATVFVFDTEPFVDPDARLTHLLKAGDWTTGVSGAGNNRTAGALRFVDTGSGLGDPFDTPVGPFVSTEFAVPNQYQPAISVATFSGRSGEPRPGVVFFPAPGDYDAALLETAVGFPVALTTDHVPAEIRYRLSPSDPWELYTEPLRLTGDATVEAYAGGAAPNLISPIARGHFRFLAQDELAPGIDVDLDGDGLGDSWEKAFGVDDPGIDSDGDGEINQREHDHGTDPRDPTSTPPVVAAGFQLAITGYDPILQRADLRASGPEGAAFRIEWSPDLEDPWTDLTGLLLMPAGGQLDLADDDASDPRRFYRIAVF